jgi:hypothetical protein
MNGRYFSAACAVFMLLFTACKEDENSVTAITNTMTSGDWRISYFVEGGNQSTDTFSDYAFTFSSGPTNTVIASDGEASVTGAWGIGYEDNDATLNLDFGADSTFIRLNKDWRVTDLMDTRLTLQHDSLDYLTFDKN